MPRSAPFATACVLSYNRPQFLKQMLGSLVAFAEHPLEVIVHDDGSSDPDLRLYLHHMVDKGCISTLIENPPGHNQGQGVALNRMFGMAQGDPIIKLDHDLIFSPGWLRKCVAVLDSNDERAHNERLVRIEPLIGALGFHRYPVEPVRYEDMFIRDWPGSPGWEEHKDFVGSGFAVPRWVWEKFGPFEEHSAAFAEDISFKKLLQENDCRLALPHREEYATNQGFGVGPSTVVPDHGQVAEIHEGPRVFSEASYIGKGA